jgi:hypothetical protein
MREIKFRGMLVPDHLKKKNNGTWIYGSLYEAADNRVCVDQWVVDPRTVGQYTGLKDNDGVEIYEGDVINDGKGAGTIEYCQPIAAFVVRPTEPAEFAVYQLNKGNTVGPTTLVDSEIIGNIYENPELATPKNRSQDG